MDFCERIERMAKARNESIYSLEKEWNIGNGTIGKLKGDKSPSVSTLKKLASHFGCSMEMLLAEEPGQTVDSISDYGS